MNTFAFRTPIEASELLDIAYITVVKYIRSGYIKAKKIGRNYLISDDEIRDFIRKNKKRKPGRPFGKSQAH